MMNLRSMQQRLAETEALLGEVRRERDTLLERTQQQQYRLQEKVLIRLCARYLLPSFSSCSDRELAD